MPSNSPIGCINIPKFLFFEIMASFPKNIPYTPDKKNQPNYFGLLHAYVIFV
jgi:hypothetical protein